MATKVLLRPLSGAAVWGLGGVGLGVMVPPALAQVGAIYSTSLVTTTFFGGALAVLVPLGATRGLLSAVQDVISTQGQPAIQKALKEMNLEKTTVLTQEGNPQLLESLTFGSSWRGRLIRTAASPFLPSTTQMLTRVQEAIDSQTSKASDEKVLSAAIGGFVEGFLQDKKDSFSLIGAVVYAVILGAGYGVDYSYRRANELKIQDAREKLQETKDSWQAKVEEYQEKFILPESVIVAQEKLVELKDILVKGKKDLDPYIEQAEKAATLAKDEAQEQGRIIYEKSKVALEDEDNQEKLQQYMHQAGEAVEVAADEMQVQGHRLYEQTIDTLSNKENQEKVKRTWKDMMINAGDAMEQAQDRIREDKQFQDMAESMNEVLKEARKQFGEEEEKKADQDKPTTIRDKISSWWRRGDK